MKIFSNLLIKIISNKLQLYKTEFQSNFINYKNLNIMQYYICRYIKYNLTKYARHFMINIKYFNHQLNQHKKRQRRVAHHSFITSAILVIATVATSLILSFIFFFCLGAWLFFDLLSFISSIGVIREIRGLNYNHETRRKHR